jgi:hypothetical protein
MIIKRLERLGLMHELVPLARRFAVLVNPADWAGSTLMDILAVV